MRTPFRALEAFEAVARLGSFTAAAKELGVSRSALSHLVKDLEDRLGVALIVRGPSGLTISGAGVMLQRRLHDALEAVRDAVDEASNVAQRQRITLSAPPFFAGCFLRGDFAAELPGHLKLVVQIEVENRFAAVERGQNSCAVRFGTGQWPGVRAELMLRVRFTPVCAPDLLSGATADTVLRTARRLIFTGDTDGWTQLGAQLGLSDDPLPSRRFESFIGALQECLNGGGVMLAPVELIGPELSSRRLSRLTHADLPSRQAFYFIAHPALFEQPQVVALRQLIVRRIARSRTRHNDDGDDTAGADDAPRSRRSIRSKQPG